MYIAIFAANGLWAGHPIMTELAGHGLLSMRERKDAQLERKSSVKSAGRDSDGTCMGFGGEASDEPLEKCKQCIACTSYQWKEE